MSYEEIQNLIRISTNIGKAVIIANIEIENKGLFNEMNSKIKDIKTLKEMVDSVNINLNYLRVLIILNTKFDLYLIEMHFKRFYFLNLNYF